MILKKKKSDTVKEIILQLIVLSVAIYYIRKIVKLFPSVISEYKSSKDDNLTFFTRKDKEININISTISAGEIVLTIVLISTQRNLLKKIESISNVIKDKIDDLNSNIKNVFNKGNKTKDNEEKEEEEGETNITKIKEINDELKKENFQQKIVPTNINNYSDRVLPINTREENTQNNFNQNNMNSFNQQNNMNSFNQQNNMNNFNRQNNMNDFNQQNSMNGFNQQNSMNGFNQQNSMNGFNQQNSMNNFNQQNSINSFDQNDTNNSTNISDLKINQNLYSQEFKPLEVGGNFSFLSDNSQNVNITKSLDYSSLLNDIYS